MALSYKELSLIGELNAFPYESLVHRIISTNILSGIIKIPLAGTYHLICVTDGSKYPRFFKYTGHDLTSVDVLSDDIMDGIYNLDISFKNRFEEL